MSALEEQVINICNKVFDERKGEFAPTSQINSPWMTEIQLAEYWQLRNKDDVDRWAREEAERQRRPDKQKGRNGLHAVGD